MPTYDYRCLKCGKVFEAFQKMSDAPLGECIHCKGKVERLISSGSGIIFKGSGFYETDYKQKNRKAASNDDKGCKGCPDNKCDLKKGK
ncbi:MAG: zinc ribbon domain-containing protein [Candidatus Omnitrophica bacterium]|nr:zinc ribbon domain-containing protein [Candidatus Omnitrophota bacterium]MCF7877432.1 zinc ribbon domain-containing protein [Candidatus Omnitrophota bacterium]MCF7892478.1 zinc ribbon domain-containing protein [Candidatus Omnitrophota bacterium]MCF7897981.1 zinc ribbon domain-containing protein [Candidatus Omnitrophota bacterium]MCF7909746.1 zinc ribbon domain-containing protein [Candidatus Omnitrophota bacterium]